MNCDCKHCGSKTLVKASVFYLQNTSIVDTRGRSVGVGLAPGALGVGVGRTHTKGTGGSQAAQAIAPPQKRRGAILVGFGVFLTGWWALASTLLDRSYAFAFGALLGLGLGLAFHLAREREWVRRMAIYDLLWYCTTCGTAQELPNTQPQLVTDA